MKRERGGVVPAGVNRAEMVPREEGAPFPRYGVLLSGWSGKGVPGSTRLAPKHSFGLGTCGVLSRDRQPRVRGRSRCSGMFR